MRRLAMIDEDVAAALRLRERQLGFLARHFVARSFWESDFLRADELRACGYTSADAALQRCLDLSFDCKPLTQDASFRELQEVAVRALDPLDFASVFAHMGVPGLERDLGAVADFGRLCQRGEPGPSGLRLAAGPEGPEGPAACPEGPDAPI
jgi:hypothetical protein